MLEDYKGRNLTYPSDRLPAFSGLATMMSDVVNDTYFAGCGRASFRMRCFGYGIVGFPLEESVREETGHQVGLAPVSVGYDKRTPSSLLLVWRSSR